MTAKDYTAGTRFFSATGKVKAPLTVTTLKTAEHEDRKNRISNLKTFLMSTWNTMYPKKFGKMNYEDEEFQKQTKKQRQELKYLLSLGKDIVNLDGGVIYCAETNTWAEKAQCMLKKSKLVEAIEKGFEHGIYFNSGGLKNCFVGGKLKYLDKEMTIVGSERGIGVIYHPAFGWGVMNEDNRRD